MKQLIRRAALQDADAMAGLDALCFSVPWSRQAFVQELSDNPAAVYFVVAAGDSIIGYGGFWAVLDEGHITNIAVHPDHRRKGLGGSLLSELIRFSERQGIQKQTLEVRVSNEPAILLYRKYGFTDFGIRKNYYPDNRENALIMWRSGSQNAGVYSNSSTE